MVRKQCPCCGKISYSAAEQSPWICPYCREQIAGASKLPYIQPNQLQ